jgi:hypothetical protein
MSKLENLMTLGLVAALLSVTGVQRAKAQDSSTPTDASSQSQTQEPAPAYGQENPPPAVTENPPLSGLDIPSLEPNAAPLSYLQPGATVSESADSNAENTVGGGTPASVSRALGSVTMQRLWSHYDLALDYMGGVGYYDLPGEGLKALQQMDFDQKITWKRGEFNLRDSFSYLPEGNFGAAYGSLGSQGIASLGTTAFSSFWGGSALGTLGLVSRILNVSLADLSEYVSPKSAITAAAGYGFSHFYGNLPANALGTQVTTPAQFIGSSQYSAQLAYNRVLSSHTQAALMYGYQNFSFSAVGTSFHSHLIQLMYGHRISGRMDLLIAAGPQITDIGLSESACTVFGASIANCSADGGTVMTTVFGDRRLGVAGRARLRYQFPKLSLEAQYERFETSGSGIFAGAQTDNAVLSASRPLSRVWSLNADLGYSRNSRLVSLTAAQQQTCVPEGQPNSGNLPVCPGINANTYAYGFVGLALHRAFGHNFHGFASYQFNELSFDNSYCAGLPDCSRISNRHVVTIGLDWTPRPIRLD